MAMWKEKKNSSVFPVLLYDTGHGNVHLKEEFIFTILQNEQR